MSIDARSAARPISTVAPARLARARRGSLAVLVLVVLEFVIGVGLLCYAANLYLLPPPGRRG
jgi:hypothetical protein